jgi:HlyD family secretion protein
MDAALSGRAALLAVFPRTMIRDTSSQDVLIKASAHRPARRWVIRLAAVAALFALVAVGARRWLLSEHSVDSARVRIAEVVRGKLVRDIAADGRVVAANNPTLYAIAAGTVQLKVQAGDTVKRGQPLAEIASPELKSRLAQEQATLAGVEAEVGRADLVVQQGRATAQKTIDQALIDRQTAVRELQGFRQAFSVGAVPEIDVRRAEDSLKKAEIALAHARKDRDLQSRGLGFDLRTKRLGLDRQRAIAQEFERQVAALVIRSPVDGQVGQLLVAQHANVAANAPVLNVVDLTAFELEIRVPDSFARDLAIGMPAEISAGANKFKGRVRSVSPEVVSGEVASRVQFVGKKPDGLRQNQRLTARILLDEKADVLMVERGPFVEAGGHAYFVVDGVAERRPLRTGAASLDAVEILSGARAGDRIVVSGADSFGDADRVRLAGE